MPIFEYACRSCKSEFEVLVQGDQRPACPHCDSAKLEKKLSGFAVGAGVPAAVSAGAACGSCGDPRGPGACSLS